MTFLVNQCTNVVKMKMLINLLWFVSCPNHRSSSGQGKHRCCFWRFIWDRSSVPWKWREFALFYGIDPLCCAGCDGPPLQPRWGKGLRVLQWITVLRFMWWVSFATNLLQMC